MINELKTGWLGPDGSFFECHSYDHISLSKELQQRFGYLSKNNNITRTDDILLENGWCYIGISSFYCHEWRIGWNKFLTEYQKHYLKPYFEESDIPVNEMSVFRWNQERNH